MPNPTRFTSGVATAAKGSTLANYPRPDPTKCYSYFNDFDTYVAGDWTVTSVGAATRALKADAPFGALLMTTTGTEDDGTQLQLTTETFTVTVGKKLWFKARFAIDDVTQSDFGIGLMVLDTTALDADGDGVTDGIFFAKDDGDALLDFQVQKDATTGQSRATSVATLVNDTFVTVGVEYDGKSEVKYFIDDVHKGTITLSSTNMPNTPLTVTMALLTGEGNAAAASVDYVFAAIER
jgi:hypothetical protein